MTGAGRPVPMATRPVPVRPILATIGLVLATYAVLELVVQARRVLDHSPEDTDRSDAPG
ncbi:hypothetical protein SHL15_6115 [Streptomyces hygroscopicus subsp. limoneus]|nr:hypothetical protein SHL15_6115 [Streptomyces hygroscopicus subsp. limoneus]